MRAQGGGGGGGEGPACAKATAGQDRGEVRAEDSRPGAGRERAPARRAGQA